MTDPVLLALLPLSGVVGGFIVQGLIAGRTVYIGSITAERSRWIGKLRETLSAYYSLSSSVVHRLAELGAETDADRKRGLEDQRAGDLKKLEELGSLLRLQLNPYGVIDGNVMAIVEHLQAHQADDGHDMSSNRDLLISHSQWLLKAEWEKVKWEAGGWFQRLRHWCDEAVRLREYERWVVGTGAAERGEWPVKLREFARRIETAGRKPAKGRPKSGTSDDDGRAA